MSENRINRLPQNLSWSVSRQNQHWFGGNVKFVKVSNDFSNPRGILLDARPEPLI